MSSDRAYRKALSKEVIRGELNRGRDTQFDSHMIDVFLELLDEGALSTQQNENGVKNDLSDVTSVVGELIT